ncbi:MAG: TIGR00374 family protein, partial [Actinomycetota bacterium]|nr:TIGR00374 family protein [Actinomycetota bacterium]
MPSLVALPEDFEPRRLRRRAAQLSLVIAVLVLVALLAPGLGDVRDRLDDARPGWLALAVALEALSCLSYVLMFRPVFCPHMSRRTANELALSELGVGALVPASGAAGLALGAWVLREGGMAPDQIVKRSVAFFLIKSSVNFVAVAVVGTLAAVGLGPDLSPLLTVLPASVSVALIAAVIAMRGLGAARPPVPGASRARRWAAA